MCTVSFVPTPRGFHLAMNRDEKRARVKGLPPEIIHLGSRRAILPREPGGGTWIAVNESGICLALINWHQIERAPRRLTASRGIVIESLAGCQALAEVSTGLKRLPLDQLSPFRLLGADAAARELVEWRWDLRHLRRHQHAWAVAHWFSSGFDELEAERVRSDVCRSAGDHAFTRIAALRALHRSHLPESGPFSICMHRDDAVTVSYAEVSVSNRRVAMRYSDGAPCTRRQTTLKSVQIAGARAE